MYGESFQSVRIAQNCIFCGQFTNEVQQHKFDNSYNDFSNNKYHSETLTVPFPAHDACLKKAKQIDTSIKWLWFFDVVFVTIATFVMPPDTNNPILASVFLFGYFGPILYFTIWKNRRWSKKIMQYYETHRFGEVESRW